MSTSAYGALPPDKTKKGAPYKIPTYRPVDAPSKATSKPADVPQPLWDAILIAAKKNGVTPQVLAGIWRTETGSVYPNPYANGLGYGGAFGTQVTAPFGSAGETKSIVEPPLQQQADTAASILRANIRETGNLHDALLKYSGGSYYEVPGVTVPRTAAQKAADANAATAARIANPQTAALSSEGKLAQAISDLKNPSLIDTQAQLSLAKSTTLQDLKLQQHFTDPWVIQNVDKNGVVRSFSYDTGVNPPAATKDRRPFLIGGQPITKTQLADRWDATYADTYEQYTGKAATPADIARVVESGVTPFGLKSQLATQPAFQTSPIYKANAPGLAAAAKQVLGKAAPKGFVAKAIAEGWDSDTINANLRALPQYTEGPEYKANLQQMNNTYRSIYGNIPAGQEATIEAHTAAGWSPAQFGQFLRGQQSYKTSPEYQQNTASFLTSLGIDVPAMPPPSSAPVESTYAAREGGPQPPAKAPAGGYAAREGTPTAPAAQAKAPPPPQYNVEQMLHQAGLTSAETKQLHQIWATSLNPDGSRNVAQAEAAAKPIADRLTGTAYTAGYGKQEQQALGSYGEGLLTKQQQQTLSQQLAPGTASTPAGIKLQAAYDRALQRMHGAFQGVLASPAVNALGQQPNQSDLGA